MWEKRELDEEEMWAENDKLETANTNIKSCFNRKNGNDWWCRKEHKNIQFWKFHGIVQLTWIRLQIKSEKITISHTMRVYVRYVEPCYRKPTWPTAGDVINCLWRQVAAGENAKNPKTLRITGIVYVSGTRIFIRSRHRLSTGYV